jgi:4-cresol dehydrogenase (hydroxylating)
MQKTLPPNLTEKEFSKALDEFAAVVGREWVFAEASDLRGYRDPYAPGDIREFTPSAAVAPDGVEEIRKVLAIANEHGIPLWPISTGKNLVYGAAAPLMPGTVTLDLKRMNRILEVNEDSCYALVEPGVSYFDLYKYIQDRGLKLWLDVASPGWGSVLGNTLERGVGYTPYGDHFQMQCGMEVVLADGDVLRTGMGSMSGSNTWQLFKYGFGPYVDGLFTQSNFGVVTKLGVWLMPEPPGYRSCRITFAHEEDIEQIIEILRPLKIAGLIPNAAVLSTAIYDTAVVSTRAQWYDGKGPLPKSVVRKMMDELDGGFWQFAFALYGPDKVMDASWEAIRGAFSQIPGSKFFSRQFDKNTPIEGLRDKLQAGIPNMQEFGLANWTGGGGLLVFSPISPTTGTDATRQYKMVRDRMAEYGFDYLGGFVVGWREMHHIVMVAYNRKDKEEKRRARELFGVLIDDAAAAGYGEYRTHLAFMDKVARTYDFNDNAMLRFSERLKDSLDPNGILAPGKQGIWPKHLRDSRGGGKA